MNKKLFSVILAFFMVIPFLVCGATMEAGDNYYLASSSTVNDNLYVASPDANISGIVTGDLFVFGGNVLVVGTVEGDLMSAGGTLNISGRVSGDERVAGGNIMISNFVGGDLLVAGGQISVLSGAVIEKDVEIAGGNINFSGESNGKLSINGGNVYINGKVNGDLSINAESVKLGPNAVIAGNFKYSSLNEAVLEEGAKINGTIDFSKMSISENKEMPIKQSFFGFITFGLIIKLITLIFTVLIFFYLFKNQAEAIVKEGVSNFWKNTGKGFILLVVVPVAIILSFITVIGSVLGVIAMFSYIVLLIVSSIVANLFFAQLCMKYIFKKEEQKLNWWIIVLSILVFGLISLIPFIGWLFKFIIFLTAFSSLTGYIFNKLKK
jgi:cytoskeletal protein CcmA (bactofilin family)